MKLVIAYIQPFKLEPVTRSLEAIPHFPGMTVTDARGFGREKVEEPPHSNREALTDFAGKVRIETLVHDAQVDAVVHVIVRTAHTGRAGDGKLLVLPVERAVRVATFEEGEAAV